ncbi:GNAT family N-acetyltransferase [Actinomadura sp. NPDC048955]|uniref:GNAT family N-acetyltransferase n=1 Tax=Actinomadura sp. NPDC048955 TaxID=3158228 RepID=UPI0033F3C28E
MLLRMATPADLGGLLDIYDSTLRWLAGRGIDQWQEPRLEPEMMKAAILASIHHRQTWCAIDERGRPAGMVTIKPRTQPGLWLPEEEAEPHRYIYLSLVSREHAGTGLGADLVDWAASRAAREGAHWIRGDAWTGNTPLTDYYLRQGWELVRVVHRPDQPSGVLLQRRAKVRETPRLVEVTET